VRSNEMPRLKQLEDGNGKRRKVIADPSLVKEMLQDTRRRIAWTPAIAETNRGGAISPSSQRTSKILPAGDLIFGLTTAGQDVTAKRLSASDGDRFAVGWCRSKGSS